MGCGKKTARSFFVYDRAPLESCGSVQMCDYRYLYENSERLGTSCYVVSKQFSTQIENDYISGAMKDELIPQASVLFQDVSRPTKVLLLVITQS